MNPFRKDKTENSMIIKFFLFDGFIPRKFIPKQDTNVYGDLAPSASTVNRLKQFKKVHDKVMDKIPVKTLERRLRLWRISEEGCECSKQGDCHTCRVLFTSGSVNEFT